MDWLRGVLLKIVEWILALLKKLVPEPEEPEEPKIYYQAVVYSDSRVGVREEPFLDSPIVWRLQENEVASLGSDPIIESSGGWKFYYIVFGDKLGWIRENDDRWHIATVQLP